VIHVQESPDRQPRRHRLPHPRTLKKLGVASVAVYSEADAHACTSGRPTRPVLGPAPGRRELPARRQDPRRRPATGAEAIHPGYGFLSENPDFADACGRRHRLHRPHPAQMRAFGLKHTARELAEQPACRCCPAAAC
jgi:urea carboxylase